MALNVTTAVFGENCNTVTASPSLAQWDTEQVLQISGIDLPDSYTVEFSTVYTRNAIPEIGDASGVTIPNVLLQRSAPITAYVVLYGENGGRNREYWITIHITPGQPPETITPDPEQAGVIDQAIAALNNGVARTEAAATSAEESAIDAEAAAEAVQNLSVAAETLATGEPATVEKTVDTETGAVTLTFGLPRGVKGDPLTYEDLTQEQKAELVQGPILEAQNAAVTAVGNARASAVDAVGSAGTTAVNAVNQAGTTQVGAVEDKGDEVLASIPSDYSDLTAEVADLSRQISDLESIAARPLDVVWIDGIQVSYNSGIEYSQAGNSASDYLDVAEYAGLAIFIRAIVSNGFWGVSFFNESKAYISGNPYATVNAWSENVYIIPDNAKYVRFNCATHRKTESIIRIDGGVNTAEALYDAVSVLKTDNIFLFNVEWIADKKISYNTGIANDETGKSATDFINVSNYAGCLVNINGFVNNGFDGCAFYDENQAYISGVSYGASGTYRWFNIETRIPPNSVYMRFCCQTAQVQNSFAKIINNASQIILIGKKTAENELNISTLGNSLTTLNNNSVAYRGTYAANSDLNNVTLPGIYWLSGAYSNGPYTSLNGWLFYVKQPSTTELQFYLPVNLDELWVRRESFNSWQNWEQKTYGNGHATCYALGSSIMAGTVVNADTNRMGGFFDTPWGVVADALGISRASTTFHYEGSKAMIVSNNTSQPKPWNELIFDLDVSSYDVILTHFGAEDVTYSGGLGTPNDTATDSTICGKTVKFIEEAKRQNPLGYIVLIAPFPNRDVFYADQSLDPYTTTFSPTYVCSLKDFDDAIDAVCQKYGNVIYCKHDMSIWKQFPDNIIQGQTHMSNARFYRLFSAYLGAEAANKVRF